MKENAIYIPDLNSCVKDFYIKDNTLFYVNFDNSVSSSPSKFIDFKTNFIFDTASNICYISKNELIPDLNIYEYQFNFLMGLSSILIAFSFLMGLIIVGATR
ncbi:hypothetical protein CCAL9344_04550 [Campylobacter sp. RM9344]|uniref:Uncharacterized protein n=1 Tax=Campylobacter californiensis TaxID=1032243 RepID=A0AAW3ZU44_9BACT|nr:MULTISPECIES: hypothetical protein [unclassified Campylobacter]MBE2984230.1 hypothetical protein [Campylobacter sp. RM6883]MBE2986015.1 hypothetical protein [Campylobacter sp. RM12919]MBE2988305.1 hypothetical protein [Campylobacter sp. RM12920]MBE2994903.1 hypothetical protein [Campylobacter sp. RM6913]MBE3029459.1 hypothetical protein [Campylobacter sp. RM9344]